jgi:solute carrier family 35 protein F5
MAEHSIIGDILGLLSAVSYGLFTGTLFVLAEVITPTISLNSVKFFWPIATVLLKKISGKEGEGADVQKVFGYIGLFTLVAMWWLGEVSCGFS